MTTTTHNFTVGAPISNAKAPLTIEQIQRAAPSAFAAEAYQDMSDRYAYIPTERVIQGMQAAGFSVFSAKQSRTREADRREHTKHMLRFRTAGDYATIKVGDVIPEVVLVNSHDGTSAYKLMAGLFRLACSNGLMVSEGLIDSISIRHTGNVVDDVIEGTFRILDDLPKALDTVQEWRGLALTDGQQAAYAEAAHVIRFADADGKVETPITAAQLLAPRRTVDRENDLFTTFNRVQENVIKGGLSARRRREPGERGTIRATTTRQVNGIAEDVRLNKALWTLTERMAALVS